MLYWRLVTMASGYMFELCFDTLVTYGLVSTPSPESLTPTVHVFMAAGIQSGFNSGRFPRTGTSESLHWTTESWQLVDCSTCCHGGMLASPQSAMVTVRNAGMSPSRLATK